MAFLVPWMAPATSSLGDVNRLAAFLVRLHLTPTGRTFRLPTLGGLTEKKIMKNTNPPRPCTALSAMKALSVPCPWADVLIS